MSEANVPVKPRIIIGWRETIALPDLGIASMKAKIDTGARTSALHAENPSEFLRNGDTWVRFDVPVEGTFKAAEARLIDTREIKNTGGAPEERRIIETRLVLGQRSWLIEISLADRARMGFDLILGRTAIRRRRLLVNPGQSYLAGAPRRAAQGPRGTGNV